MTRFFFGFVASIFRMAFIHPFGKLYDFSLYLEYLIYMYKNRGVVKYKVYRSESCEPTEKVCVFVLYQPRKLSGNTYKYLEAIKRQGYSIMAISNVAISATDLDKLNLLCFQLIERDNIGRDFGAYKTGILEIYKQQLPVKHLLIANDSVHAPLHDLSPMHSHMEAQDYDFWGVADNSEISYHVGSYYVAFGEKVLSDARFKRFWECYAEKNSRRHVIKRGEVALSKLLLSLGFNIGVYKTGKDIIDLVKQMNINDLVGLLFTFKVSVLYKYASRSYGAVHQLERLRSDIGNISKLESEDSSLNIKSFKYRVALCFGEIFENCSSAHVGALIFNNYLDYPLLKKDLVFRELYDFGFLMSNIKITTDISIDEIEADFRVKGVPKTNNIFKRMLIYSGYM